MIPIALMDKSRKETSQKLAQLSSRSHLRHLVRTPKFTGLNFITCIEVSHMTRHSRKSNKLRNVNTVRGRTENGPFQKRKMYYVREWSGDAMVLGKLPVPGRPTIWI